MFNFLRKVATLVRQEISGPLKDKLTDKYRRHHLSLLLCCFVSVTQGLSCVNDLVSTVSCKWNGAPVAPGVNCLITGAMTILTYEGRKKIPTEIT